MLNEPYPKVEVTTDDKQLAERISSIAFGKEGELTSVMQYTYQSIFLPERYAYVSDILDCISITEMRHYEILNKLILLLGGDIRVAVRDRGRYVYWNGSYPDYVQNLKKMLYSDIKAEKRAVSEYGAVIEHSHDPKVNKLLKRIISDEEHHISILTDTYVKLFGK